MSNIDLKIVEYNADKGMKHVDGGSWIVMNDNTERLIKNIKFYDPIRGFIQTTDGILYMPTQGALFANH